MKNIFSITFVIAIITLTSCKKPYQCECTATDTGGGTTVTTSNISKTSKKTAQAICGNSTSVYTQSFSSGSGTSGFTQTTTTSCNLK